MKSPTCKFCGRSEGLRWAKLSGGRFKMYEVDANGRMTDPHECPEFVAAYQKSTPKKDATNTPVAAENWATGDVLPIPAEFDTRLRAVESRTEFLTEATAKLADTVDNGVKEAKLTREVVEGLRREIDARRTIEVVTKPNAAPATVTGLTHRDFAKLLKMVKTARKVWLHGGAGTFKTSTARQIAEALLPDRDEVDRFFPQSVGAQTSKSDLLGYTTVAGDYIESPLYRARKFGGLFLLDEVDAGNTNVLTILNAAVENDVVLFPNGELVTKHPEFYVIAAGNTTGKGANATYLGRNPIDGATTSRFRFFRFDADWTLTSIIAENIAGDEGRKWTAHVERVDARVNELKLAHPVGPRAAIGGAEMLRDGFTWDVAEEACIYGAMKADDVAKVRAGLV